MEWYGGFANCIAVRWPTFYALSAESDAAARQVSATSMPNLVHVDDVTKVRAQDFVALLERRRPRAILGGG